MFEVLVLVVTRDPVLAAILALPALGFVVGRRFVRWAQRSLELNEQLALAFAIPIPDLAAETSSPIRPIRSRQGAAAIAITIAAAAGFVAFSIITRDAPDGRGHRGGPPSTWAANANAVCGEMAQRYRDASAARGAPIGPSRTMSLTELAAIRREGLEIE